MLYNLHALWLKFYLGLLKLKLFLFTTKRHSQWTLSKCRIMLIINILFYYTGLNDALQITT